MNFDTNKTILVMGTARGGTTLITASLGAHPDIAMLDEEYTGAVFHVTGGKIRGNKLCVPNQIEWRRSWHWWNNLVGFSGFLRKRKLYNLMPRSELSIVDYIERAPVQPVCILREPNAVINSIMKRERRSAGIAIYRWTRFMEVVEQLQAESSSLENLSVPAILSFESLVKQPEAVLRALCDQIGLPFNEVMLEGPMRNVRYPRNSFEVERSKPKEQECHLSKIPDEAMRRYERLLERDIGLPVSADSCAE